MKFSVELRALVARASCALLVTLCAVNAVAETAPEATPSSATAPAAAPQGETTVAVPAKPTIGTPKFNALLQAWSVNDNSKTAGAANLNFRLRRAELKLSGTIAEGTRYFVMLDAAKAIQTTGTNPDNRVLQDIGVAFKIVPNIEITAGQFKTMTSAEGLQSSAELLLPERSLVGRTFGDRREPGLMVGYEDKAFKARVMASNGQGSNQNAIANSKDLSMRVDYVIRKELRVGAFALLGDFKYTTKGAVGANVTVLPFRDTTLNLEVITGRTNNTDAIGFTVEAAQLITEKFQPVVRYSFLKPRTAASLVAEEVGLGINYLLFGNNAKLQLGASYLSNMSGNNGSPSVAGGSYGTVVTAAFQASI